MIMVVLRKFRKVFRGVLAGVRVILDDFRWF